MRNAFAKEMVLLARDCPELVLLTGDIGNRLFDEYKALYPDRFYNCGVAEANMTSVAAGMAMSGLKPVTYTITPFNTFRCLEQIKIDLCHHNLPVIIVGVGAGLSYSELGATHQSCEDISILRSLPGMSVVCPGDAIEVKLALRSALLSNSPVYLRLGKKNEPIIHKKDPNFELGTAIEIHKGVDICLISTGNILSVAAETVKYLADKGLNATFISMHTVKPLDNMMLDHIFKTHSIVATIEEHSLIGGLGSAVLEWISDQRNSDASKLIRFGCQDQFMHFNYNQKKARDKFGLNAKMIADQLFERWNNKHED